MRLGIDVSRYKHSEATGVEWYSKHIVDGLLPLLAASPRIEEASFYSPRKVDLPIQSAKFKHRVIPFARLWTQARLSYEILTNTPDALFVPSHTIPVIYPRKSIITIHDVAFRRFKLAYSFAQYRYLNWSTRFAVKNAYRIIVPSEATKKDLVHFYKCNPEVVSVVHHGQPDFVDASKLDVRVLEKYGIGPELNYMLFVGRLEAKKNLIHVLEAFKGFVKEFPDWNLVLAGKEGCGFAEIQKKIDELELGGNVILTGYVSEEEKALLYDNSQFVVFPSLYEGFGFPILEAFQHGKALLTSKGSACEEIAGDAALLIDSHDKKEICDGMKKLAMNTKLCEDLVKRGSKRLQDFSWQKAAKETLAVLVE